MTADQRKGLPLRHIEEAILKTVLYADIFSFPLTFDELHHFLIAETPISRFELEYALAASAFLRAHIECQPPYLVRAGRADLIEIRRQREDATDRLWPQALRYGRWLSRLPFVRMVALTGAIAMRNAAHEGDDIDYVLVTCVGRVWLARAFAILLVRAARWRGIALCPNYVMAESALEQERRDLYIAHEVAQMVPLYGLGLYETLRIHNKWVFNFMPHAHGSYHQADECAPGALWVQIKRGLEWLLGGRLGAAFERWEYARKRRKFAREMEARQQAGPHAAHIDEEQVKGHFDDHGHPILRAYFERLRQCQLDALSLAGD